MLCTGNQEFQIYKLWFDVGIKRYTTGQRRVYPASSCGLMWESKDIQLLTLRMPLYRGCGLMWESKDIQPTQEYNNKLDVVV